MLKSLSLVFLLCVGLSARAEEQGCLDESSLLPDDFTQLANIFAPDPLKFKLTEDGSFDLELNIEFPPEMEPVEVLKKFTHPETVISNSNIIKKLEYVKNSKIVNPEACATPEVVSSRSCKSIACAETKSLCSYTTISHKRAEYRCKVDPSHKTTKELFHSGKTQYACKKTKGSTSCSFKMEGRPRPYDTFFISRTSRQLALGGAVETAIGHLKIALPMALDKPLIYKTLLRTKSDFYKEGAESMKTDPTRTIHIKYN